MGVLAAFRPNTASRMERAVPILPADDLRAARAFYVGALGFTVSFEQTDDGVTGLLGVRRGSIELTIDAPMPGHGRDEPWGARTFDLLDPSGNTLFIIGPAT